MVPRTPATGRFVPMPLKHDKSSTPPSSTPSSASSSASPSHTRSPRTHLPPRPTAHLPKGALLYSPPPSTPNTTASSLGSPSLPSPLATPTPASPPSSSSLSSLEREQYEAESQLDRLIAQAEYALSQQQRSPFDGSDAVTAFEEREVKDLLLRYHRLKADSLTALHDVRGTLSPEEKRPNAAPAEAASPYVPLLEEKLKALQAQYDAQQIQLLAAQHTTSQHETTVAALRAAEAANAELRQQNDALTARVRAMSDATHQLETALADASANAEMWEAEFKSERDAHLARGREAAEARERRRDADEALKRVTAREQVMREEGERAKGEMKKARKAQRALHAVGRVRRHGGTADDGTRPMDAALPQSAVHAVHFLNNQGCEDRGADRTVCMQKCE